MTEILPLILQGGAVAVFVLVFYALINGRVRTMQELEQCEKRAVRAEGEADKERARSDLMIPAVQALTATVTQLTQQLGELTEVVAERRGATP